MTFDILLAAAIFSFAGSMTPGPNNFMLLASGVNFGFRRTIPHMAGILVGMMTLMLAVGFGLGSLLNAYPSLHLALKIIGAAYLLYLAWRIGSARTMGKGSDRTEPMTAFQAGLFQWVNPKAWVVALTAMSLFSLPEEPYRSAIAVSLACITPMFLSVTVWSGFGVALRDWLADPVRLKWFNITMGVLLVLTLYPMLA
ncbi:MAG: LysE family translocator [Rhodobiaceae bacterium]|nr:LysE family translocator [Rhodobiaceae bacterium]